MVSQLHIKFVFSTPGSEQIQRMCKMCRISSKKCGQLSNRVKDSPLSIQHDIEVATLYGVFTCYIPIITLSHIILWRHPIHIAHMHLISRE